MSIIVWGQLAPFIRGYFWTSRANFLEHSRRVWGFGGLGGGVHDYVSFVVVG